MAFVIEDDEAPVTQSRFVIEDDPAPTPEKKGAVDSGLSALSSFNRGTLRNAVDTVIEPAVTMLTGAVAAPIGGFVGMGREMLTGDFGKGTGERTAKAVQEALTYQPRSEGGKEVLRGLGEAFDKSKLAGLPLAGAELPAIAQATAQQMPFIANKAGAAASSIAARQAAKQAALAEQSSLSAPKIDAAKRALELRIAVNPAEANPTVMNKIKSGIVGGDELGATFAIKNESRWPILAKQDLDLPKGKPLTLDLLEQGRAKYSAPYDKVRQIETIPTDAEYLGNIRGKSFLENLPAEEQALLVGSKKVDKLIKAASLDQFTGQGAVEIIKQYRADANKILGSAAATPKQTAYANAQLRVARELEANVGRRLAEMDAGNPDMGFGTLAKELKAAREYYAKSYTYQGATNLATGKVDPTKIAKLAATDNAMTGILKDIGDIAANYPMSSRIGVKDSISSPRIIRSTLGGTVGAGVGGAIGGIPGAAIGGAAGFGAEMLGGSLLKKRLASQAAQAANLPRDFRPLRAQLGYADTQFELTPNGMMKP